MREIISFVFRFVLRTWPPVIPQSILLAVAGTLLLVSSRRGRVITGIFSTGVGFLFLGGTYITIRIFPIRVETVARDIFVGLLLLTLAGMSFILAHNDFKLEGE